MQPYGDTGMGKLMKSLVDMKRMQFIGPVNTWKTEGGYHGI
jgi:hypothetical protein